MMMTLMTMVKHYPQGNKMMMIYLVTGEGEISILLMLSKSVIWDLRSRRTSCQ